MPAALRLKAGAVTSPPRRTMREVIAAAAKACPNDWTAAPAKATGSVGAQNSPASPASAAARPPSRTACARPECRELPIHRPAP